MGGVVVMYSPTVGMARLFQGFFFEDLKRPPPQKEGVSDQYSSWGKSRSSPRPSRGGEGGELAMLNKSTNSTTSETSRKWPVLIGDPLHQARGTGATFLNPQQPLAT